MLMHSDTAQRPVIFLHLPCGTIHRMALLGLRLFYLINSAVSTIGQRNRVAAVLVLAEVER